MEWVSMDLTDSLDEPIAETPEDVAILYSWANLHGAKYRDFSASRREYRAQVRHRAAEEMRESELKAKAEAEAAAADAERVAREAERTARAPESYDREGDRERAIREAEEASRRAGAERVEAARRAEAAALAEAAARREEREIAEAHASAERQAARYAESETRRRQAAGPQPRPAGLESDPYEFAQGSTVDGDLYTPNQQLAYTEPARYGDNSNSRISRERRAFRPAEPDPRRRPQGFRPDEASGVHPAYRSAEDVRPTVDAAGARMRQTGGRDDLQRAPVPYVADRLQASTPDLYTSEVAHADALHSTPSWLYTNGRSPSAPLPASSVADTLQHSRERVASRWFALKGVFDPGLESEAAQARRAETRTPVLAVFSLAGGVGKTSLVATLGRALSSLGEKVLLADTTSHGLLPYYFGASELKPGKVRTFSPPSGSPDAPIYMVSYEVGAPGSDTTSAGSFADQLTAGASGTNRVLLDLTPNSGWVMRRLSGFAPTLLIPVAPDMNSVISLQAVEKYLQGIVDSAGRPILPFYLLNQFDASLPLHLDVREVLRRQLEDRLLPTVIRRAPAVSEALAEGMTVVDYARDAPVTEDYMHIAKWLRGMSAAPAQGFRNARWSER